MKYGYFDDARREYVITRPDTPLPWINYLGSEEYFALISNTAGGYSFYKDARLRRITRYRYNNAPSDLGGRYIYVRDNEDGEYWSPSWQPTQVEFAGLFLPPRDGLYHHRLHLQRHPGRDALLCPNGREPRDLADDGYESARQLRSTFPSSPPLSFVYGMPRTIRPTSSATSPPDRWKWKTAVIYHKTEYRERRDHFAYFACSEKPSGFDTQREAFLGPYRSWDRPIVLEQGQSARFNRSWLAADWVALYQGCPPARRTEADHLPVGLLRESQGSKIRPTRIADDQQAWGKTGYRKIS